MEPGKPMASHSKSRYIESSLWRNLGEGEINHLSGSEEDDDERTGGHGVAGAPDLLTGAFMGSGAPGSLLVYHPSPANAVVLWEAHRDNVEPLCKVLHIPSIAKMVEKVVQKPDAASKVDECTLFAIYHFAVFSMAENECQTLLEEPRTTLLGRYHFAARQALVNAAFLRTTDLSVLQALVLFLMSCRHSYDPHTLWILTGVAMRIAQRIGLHRNGEKVGLRPFEVQMRRRLFYQLISLDGHASQVSGTGYSVVPNAWDTLPPLNVNDDQLWPSMTESPREQGQATDMIFCLSRSYVGRFLAMAGKSDHGPSSLNLQGLEEAEAAVKRAENKLEEKYIRYCDVVNPLHFLAVGMARAGIAYMRLRIRLVKVKDNTATDLERKEMLQLAQRIIDTDTTANSHVGLSRYAWYMRPFFLWGTWDSLIFILTTLWKRPNLLSSVEADALWSKVAEVYRNHDEVLKSKRTLHIAFRRLTLRAWVSNPPSDSVPEPDFIASLHLENKASDKTYAGPEAVRDEGGVAFQDTTSKAGLEYSNEAITFMDSTSNMSHWMDDSFDIEAADWVFWDQLTQAG
jgi:hypothetical protein